MASRPIVLESLPDDVGCVVSGAGRRGRRGSRDHGARTGWLSDRRLLVVAGPAAPFPLASCEQSQPRAWLDLARRAALCPRRRHRCAAQQPHRPHSTYPGDAGGLVSTAGLRGTKSRRSRASCEIGLVLVAGRIILGPDRRRHSMGLRPAGHRSSVLEPTPRLAQRPLPVPSCVARLVKRSSEIDALAAGSPFPRASAIPTGRPRR